MIFQIVTTAALHAHTDALGQKRFHFASEGITHAIISGEKKPGVIIMESIDGLQSFDLECICESAEQARIVQRGMQLGYDRARSLMQKPSCPSKIIGE